MGISYFILDEIGVDWIRLDIPIINEVRKKKKHDLRTFIKEDLLFGPLRRKEVEKLNQTVLHHF